MRDRGLGGAATSPSERRSEARPSGGPRWKFYPSHNGKNFHSKIFILKLQFPRDNKDMGVVGGREETEGVYK